jgi:NADPH:quinone reductase-like Zn-dependent oxidoreductase
VEIARSIGADHVIDYTHEDFTQNGELYDLILVANGNRSILEYKRSLKPKAICVLVGGGSASIVSLLTGMLLQWWISKTEGKKIGSFLANGNQQDLTFLKELLESGKVKPVIDRRYPLSEAAEALRYLGVGHAKGKIVITVEHTSET